MNRNRVATSIGIRWRNESESGGGLRRNTQLIKPPLVIRWGNTKTRARVLITYGGALIACLILTMVTYELLPDDVKKLREEKQKIARIEAEAEKKAAEMLAAKKAEERQAKENLKDTKQSMNAEKSIQQAKTDARLDEIFYNDMKTFDKAYDDAPNEIKKSEVFRQARRYEQLFFAQFQYEVVNWKGKISELSTDKGGGYLRLEIDISDGKGLFGGFKITFKDGGISRSVSGSDKLSQKWSLGIEPL